MNFQKILLLLVSHIIIGLIGVFIGIYSLPILTAPDAPNEHKIQRMSLNASYTTEFKRNLKDSDIFHWGEGTVSIGESYVTLMGNLAPGPDYKLYLSPKFIETEAQFEQFQHLMIQLGDVNTFNNFVVEIAPDTPLEEFNTIVVWCESFGEFITSAKYR
ncbi:DM13 domain-containing protein [Pseudoalteromonas sp. C2R02]|uniref:DM13 domain-containing protein n=1 Tax=Pseudoalteromonas sp. C2R02 TaxID=2841565 RepID=UPI001C0A5A04|nr:DM13 domain-containing protein [Pseudoalteromonas sp. C2R02]MBU2970172.1 DM13 domain-containing protein [Pseudoalteromonas sp. C2R02]